MEDDGILPPPAKVAKFVIDYVATAGEIAVSFGKDVSAFAPPWAAKGISVILPVGDGRQVVSSDDNVSIEPRRRDELGRKRFHILAEEQRRRSKL